jgi:hypothetical protein
MNYQELTNILGQNQNAFSGVVPANVSAPSIDQIISGISSQYQPINLGSYEPSVGGASRYITGSPSFGEIERVPEYGTLDQLIGPSFVPSTFDINAYKNIDSQKLSDVIESLGSGGGFDYSGGGPDSSPNSTSVDPDGMAQTAPVSPMAISIAASILGAVTGLPFGLVSNVIGKDTIANTLNSINATNNAAQNQATVAAMMGIPNNPENQITIQQAIDSISAINAQTNPAISAQQAAQGVQGITGAAAAAASVSAADAAAAAGHSPAGIAAAAQAAVNATLSGLTPAQVSEQANAAAVSVSISEANAAAAANAPSVAADPSGQGATGVAPPGGGEAPSADSGVSGVGPDGIGFAKGGKVTLRHMTGPNPKGKDDGYVALDAGEYVIKKSSVDKYGESLLSLINEGKVSKKKLQSLI